MALSTKTIDEIEALVRASIRGLIPGADTSSGSDYDITARLIAAIFVGNQSQAAYLAKQIFPSQADGEFLAQHGADRNLPPLEPTQSVGSSVVTATANGVLIAAGTVLTHADGTGYTTSAPATTATSSGSGTATVGIGSTASRILCSIGAGSLPVAGDLIVIGGEVRAVKATIPAIQALDVYTPFNSTPTPGASITYQSGCVVQWIADDPGPEGNKEIGDLLTFTSPPANVDADTTIQETGNGADAETDEDYRKRIRALLAYSAESGSPEGYRTAARSTPGVRLADAIIYPNARGYGTIDVVPFGLSGERVTNSVVNGLIAAHLATVAPFDDDLEVIQLVESSPATDIAINVLPHTGYEADFTTALQIDTGSTTTAINIVGSTADAEIGDRVIIPVTSAGRKRTLVRTIAGLTATQITLDSALPAVPATGDFVRPGSPNCQEIIDAIEGHFDSLGPGVGFAQVDRHPPPLEEWPVVLRLNKLQAVVLEVLGVDDATITSPAVSQLAAIQEILVPGEIAITFL